MSVRVSLRSVGNPDFGQDAGRSLPGVPDQAVTVGSLEEASQVCRKYIERYGLGGGNWAGGEIRDERRKFVGRVSYNGKVWADPDHRMNAVPLFDPTPVRPVDPFAFEKATIEVPGYGMIVVGGSYRLGYVESVPRSFIVESEVCEFRKFIRHSPDGTISFPPEALILCIDGSSNRRMKVTRSLVEALQQAMAEWATTPEARTMIYANEMKDRRREEAQLTELVGIKERELESTRAELNEKRNAIREMEGDGPAPPSPMR